MSPSADWDTVPISGLLSTVSATGTTSASSIPTTISSKYIGDPFLAPYGPVIIMYLSGVDDVSAADSMLSP